MLELVNIKKSMGQQTILENINLTIGEGEFFSLLGPSGCGKTTLLRIISGILSPTSGLIALEGKRIDQTPAHKRQFNMVFQRYALFPHLNVFDNVAFGPRAKGTDKSLVLRDVMDALGIVKMESFASRNIKTLSGGQQQRIALARALVNKPRVLLLDEPLSALDLKLRQAMQKELVSIQKQLKTTFIFVTHDQDEALTLSDRLAILNKGQVLQTGSPRKVYFEPSSSFVARFVGSINELPRQFSAGELWMIRPEKLILTREEPTHNSLRIEVMVTELFFKGQFTEVVCSSIDNQKDRFQVLVANGSCGSQSHIPALGERCWINWSRGDVIAFSGDDQKNGGVDAP